MRRALHYVFKIGNRAESIKFYTELLGMKVLRHEEFTEGCAATCNGPYSGMWSKTMIGYGPEDDHFVLELTYNYGIGSYRVGDDFGAIWIKSSKAFQKIGESRKADKLDDFWSLYDPDGHKFFIGEGVEDAINKVSINVSNLEKSKDYWNRLCGMTIKESTKDSYTLTYGESQCELQINQSEKANIDRGTGFGRIAFSCLTDELQPIQELMDKEGQKIQNRLVSLDTPGKAQVHVVILADPDDHEICFVGDEAFRELSQVDPGAEETLVKSIEADKSSEWFSKQRRFKGKKPEAQ